jgi:hypothetical protein
MQRFTSTPRIGTFKNSVIRALEEIRERLTELSQRTNMMYDMLLAVLVNNSLRIQGPVSAAW